MESLHFKPAHELAKMIRNKEVSVYEVVEAYLQQIKAHNPKLNAIITLDAEGALHRAREADEALAHGEVWGPLHGIPITIKGCFRDSRDAHHQRIDSVGKIYPQRGRDGCGTHAWCGCYIARQN